MHGEVIERRKPPRAAAPVLAVLTVVVGAWIALRVTGEGWYLQGVRQAGNGQIEPARASFRSALQIHPVHAGALHALAELDPSGPLAGKRLQAAERLRPAWIPPVITRFDRALLADDAEDLRTTLEKAKRLDPHGLETRLIEVRKCLHEKRWGEATSLLSGIARIWPQHVDVWFARVRLAEGRGRIDEAKRLLRDMLRRHPHLLHAQAWLRRIDR